MRIIPDYPFAYVMAESGDHKLYFTGSRIEVIYSYDNTSPTILSWTDELVGSVTEDYIRDYVIDKSLNKPPGTTQHAYVKSQN